MEAYSSIIQSTRGIMDENQEEIDHCNICSENEDDDDSINTICSSSSGELIEDATSPSSSSSTLSLCPAQSSSDEIEEGPLFEMSVLITQLPFKRGLSKHFNGKSQSFTSLANVKSLEDLAKPERTSKRVKSSKSYTVLDNRKTLSPKFSSRVISKKSLKGSSLSSFSGTRHSSQGSKRSITPHDATLLFA